VTKHNLVIVESPAKAKTIEKYLGKDFLVLSSFGHVRDLVAKEGAVDPKNNFAMKYELIERSAKNFATIVTQMKKADTLYLATDPDREGEAISWHILELLKEKNLIKNKTVHRVVFHEITKTAIQEAIQHPRDISMHLVDAQQARRALDYLVGFTLSPLLWRKIRNGLSAGRVQSPALRMIVEREIEIENFIAQEYWTIESDLAFNQEKFEAKLTHYKTEKLSQFSITTAEQAETVRSDLQAQAPQNTLSVINVESKTRKRYPAAPFITSTLQQEAIRKLGFSAQKTMRVAQQLYEGIDTGEGAVGLISYMRTDSVNLAQEALNEIRRYISERFDKSMLPDEIRVYKTKTKNAQEAHEAIRPTDIFKHPQDIKKHLSPEQYKLYDLIWKRTIACQMIHATINTVAVDLSCGEGNVFRANGSVVEEPGFMRIYLEGQDEQDPAALDDKMLPPLKIGDIVDLHQIRNEQHFTEPPPRYSEASLVKSLEEHGIGRPSTYAAIISTLINRSYVYLEQKRFYPSDVGRIVNMFLTRYFTQYVDYDFTANLEDTLDEVSRGEKQWIPVLEDFWKPFHEKTVHINETVQRKDVTQEAIDEACPQCEKPLAKRLGRRGIFVGCTAYPDCDYTRNLNEDSAMQSKEAEIIADRKCPECESDLIIREGRYGKFIGCSGYPKCKFMEPLEKPADTGVTCPKCSKGSLLKRKSRRGKIFYSCNTYPTCDYAIWDEPIAQACPTCHWPILSIKITKKRGTEKVCPQKECGFSEVVEDPE
jgi:DNA topoisomerase I